MTRAKPKFRVGQIVVEKKWKNNFHRIRKRYLGQQNDWCYIMFLGGIYLEEDVRPLTKRERGEEPK